MSDQANSDSTETLPRRGEGLAGAPCSAFPRNPQRDEHGNAVLYPGMPRYEGVAAIFGSKETGEVVIMAPDMEALAWRCVQYGITDSLDELNRNACCQVKLERMPNAKPSDAGGVS